MDLADRVHSYRPLASVVGEHRVYGEIRKTLAVLRGLSDLPGGTGG